MDSPELQRARDAFDRRVREELRSIPVPPDLRSRILREAPRSQIVLVRFSGSAWALAAALLVLATGLFFWSRPPGEDKTFAGFESRMTAFAVRQYSMDLLTPDLAEVRRYLEGKGAPAEFDLPAPLRKTPVKGGARLSWQGAPVSMVCFDGPNAKTLYLFVIDSTALEGGGSESQAHSLKGLASAAWTRGGKTYLLAASLPTDRLQRYL